MSRLISFPDPKLSSVTQGWLIGFIHFGIDGQRSTTLSTAHFELRATENKTQTAAEANRRFLAQSAPFMHPSFLPKYWARYGNTLLDPRSVPEAFPLSLQSSSYFFESSQGRGPWQLHRIYDSGLTTPKLRQVMMHLGLDGRVQYQSNKNQ